MFFSQNKAIVDISDEHALIKFSKFFKDYVGNHMDTSFGSLVFLCIGTDRSTGDSLGPIIGYKLSNICYENIYVFGTLNEPVHAKNLKEKTNEIMALCKNPFIIAIDACLGRVENIGHINIGKGPVFPGAAVNKNLLPIGNINITGVVNVSGYMEYMVLQNTRLNIVMKMADIITGGIMHSIDDIYTNLVAKCV